METQLVFETLYGNSTLVGSVTQEKTVVHLLLVKASHLTCYWISGNIVLIRPIQVQPVTRLSTHNHSSPSRHANISAPITHVSQFGRIREWKNVTVISSEATQHTPFLPSTHPLTHDLTHACHFGPSATNRYYCHAQYTQLFVPLFSHSRFQNNISDYERIPSFKLYHSNTEPCSTLLCIKKIVKWHHNQS